MAFSFVFITKQNPEPGCHEPSLHGKMNHGPCQITPLLRYTMGQIHKPIPVLRILAAFSRYEAAFDWTRDLAVENWGPLLQESPPFPFDQTDYYSNAMGSGLIKRFFAFANPIDPGTLVDAKLATNQWETEYATQGEHPESRPLNLDPGYITLGKLVLASTKDFCHRVYLDRGIYAESTLFFRQGCWEHHGWTFPDYRSETYHAFFSTCRDALHHQIRKETAR